ncbi:hypothetical protein SAMN04487820_11229 [Actinopolyspora mzabensis]|uniref:Uncharacterized protein n=1 Tax=Actinopolyspora mzabensis TaxID=995066 RepID=A0A1G9EGB7_ACTMZ|nr:DUF4405 domain-containing protein [Actinopolyspora mzabensis]SDK75113.1 hypothetical protein SAMN04487820_11229 [Actinopolyspora mzabensis]
MLLSLLVSIVLIGTLLFGISVHSVTGSIFVALVMVHLTTQRAWFTGLARSMRTRKRLPPGARGKLIRDSCLLGCVLLLTVTGLLRWNGVVEARPWHSSAMFLFLGAIAFHLVANRRPLRAHFARLGWLRNQRS